MKGPRVISLRRDEHGYAIMTTMLVALVVSALTATLFVTVDAGLRQTRQSGDSANALQVADAGINAAVKRLTDYTGASPLVIDETLPGTGDRYVVTATYEDVGVWQVDARGYDATGEQRRVKGVAVATPLFSNAVFTRSTMNFGSGVAVDSYIGGMTKAQTCNGFGIVGTNSPQLNDLNVQGGGGGVRNCTSQIPIFSDNPKGYVYDGCVGYANSEPVPRFLNEADNTTKRTCGSISYATPENQVDNVDLTDIPLTASSLVCSGPMNLAPGKYRYGSITLRHGCSIASSSATMLNPVKVYTDGAINIGSGSGEVVNAPPLACPSGGTNSDTSQTDYYSGTASNPLYYYCSGWPGRVQIFAAGGGNINLAQHVKFWGVVYAPQRTVTGGPHPTWWGAVVANDVASGAQLALHYDEALKVVKTGRYSIQTWREEPAL